MMSLIKGFTLTVMQIMQILLFELIQEYSIIFIFLLMTKILFIFIIFQIYVNIYAIFEIKMHCINVKINLTDSIFKLTLNVYLNFQNTSTVKS